MRISLTTLVCILILGACSSPKYTYHFDHYDYSAGKKTVQADAAAVQPAEESPLAIQDEALTASTNASPAVVPQANTTETTNMEQAKNEFAKKYAAMTKAERKEFKKELKTELKNYVKSKKSVDSVNKKEASNMDRDLKLAIIFGAVGLVLTLFGGASSAFWVLGVIAIVIGVVFLIKWLMRQ